MGNKITTQTFSIGIYSENSPKFSPMRPVSLNDFHKEAIEGLTNKQAPVATQYSIIIYNIASAATLVILGLPLNDLALHFIYW